MIAATLWAAGLGVEVRSSTDCPSAQDVTDRLLPLLPPFTGPAQARDVAQVQVVQVRSDRTRDLSIRLLRPDASEIGDRRVTLQGTCVEMAETVATILATWKTDTRPEGPDVEKLMAIVEGETPPAAPTPGQSISTEYLLGTGAGASLIGGIAATGSLELLAGRQSSHWQLRLGLATQTSRQSDLAAPGRVDWQHTNATLGLTWRLLNPRWLFSLDAGPLVGWVTLAGQGYSPSRKTRYFEYGGATGARLGRKLGRWAVWAEGRLTMWVKGYRATVRGSDESRDLPLFDATVSLGVSMAL